MGKRLTKSRKRVLAGVCGGIADYLGWSHGAVRMVWVTFSFLLGMGLIAYTIFAIAMPPPQDNDGFNIDDYRVA